MYKLFFTVLLLAFAFPVMAQQTEDTAISSKPVISLGADIVPLARVDRRTTSFGFGGSLGVEFGASNRQSFIATAGYLLLAAFPGSYNSFGADFEFVPVSFAWRRFVGNGFYLGPKLGMNIEVASPQFDDTKSSAATLFGGLSFGVKSPAKRFQPDFSLLYHGASYGSIVSFQTSLRFQFGKRN